MEKTRTDDPRQQRLASKLRENLQRRKAQARARASLAEPAPDNAEPRERKADNERAKD
ncbi:MAG TPA: hypothetical protein VIL84_00790 [Devosiaceae bacterium]